MFSTQDQEERYEECNNGWCYCILPLIDWYLIPPQNSSSLLRPEIPPRPLVTTGHQSPFYAFFFLEHFLNPSLPFPLPPSFLPVLLRSFRCLCRQTSFSSYWRLSTTTPALKATKIEPPPLHLPLLLLRAKVSAPPYQPRPLIIRYRRCQRR